MSKGFPDCDVVCNRGDYYDLKTGSQDIIFRIRLSPMGKDRPTKEQLDQVECAIIEAVCLSMEQQRDKKE